MDVTISRRGVLALGAASVMGAVFAASGTKAKALPVGSVYYYTRENGDMRPPKGVLYDWGYLAAVREQFARDSDGIVHRGHCANPGVVAGSATTTDPMSFTRLGNPLPSGLTLDQFRAVCWFMYGGPGYSRDMWPATFEGVALTEGNICWACHYIVTYAIYGHSADGSGRNWQNALSDISDMVAYSVAHASEAQSGTGLYSTLSSNLVSWFDTEFCGGANSFIKKAIARVGSVPKSWEPWLAFPNDGGNNRPSQQMVVFLPPTPPTGFLTVNKTPSF